MFRVPRDHRQKPKCHRDRRQDNNGGAKRDSETYPSSSLPSSRHQSGNSGHDGTNPKFSTRSSDGYVKSGGDTGTHSWVSKPWMLKWLPAYQRSSSGKSPQPIRLSKDKVSRLPISEAAAKQKGILNPVRTMEKTVAVPNSFSRSGGTGDDPKKLKIGWDSFTENSTPKSGQELDDIGWDYFTENSTPKSGTELDDIGWEDFIENSNPEDIYSENKISSGNADGHLRLEGDVKFGRKKDNTPYIPGKQKSHIVALDVLPKLLANAGYYDDNMDEDVRKELNYFIESSDNKPSKTPEQNRKERLLDNRIIDSVRKNKGPMSGEVYERAIEKRDKIREWAKKTKNPETQRILEDTVERFQEDLDKSGLYVETPLPSRYGTKESPESSSWRTTSRGHQAYNKGHSRIMTDGEIDYQYFLAERYNVHNDPSTQLHLDELAAEGSLDDNPEANYGTGTSPHKDRDEILREYREWRKKKDSVSPSSSSTKPLETNSVSSSSFSTELTRDSENLHDHIANFRTCHILRALARGTDSEANYGTGTFPSKDRDEILREYREGRKKKDSVSPSSSSTELTRDSENLHDLITNFRSCRISRALARGTGSFVTYSVSGAPGGGSMPGMCCGPTPTYSVSGASICDGPTPTYSVSGV